jgi:hypothetical protein
VHPYPKCKICDQYHDGFDPCEYRYSAYEDAYYDYQYSYGATEAARAKREHHRRLQEEIRAKKQKQARVDLGEMKLCSECDKERPHDLNDYVCIACRDGEDALPTPEYDVAA